MRSILAADEQGATTVIVALCVTVLFGFTALAVDAARAYQERRELQRTADVSALSGAQLLMAGEAPAEDVGRYYVTNNPTTHHPGAYNAATGDLVDAKLLSNGTGCVIDGVALDCIESTVVAPPKSVEPTGFEWVFAKVLGFDETSISAKATAVLGSGAPGGEKLVPWLVTDCPSATYEGSDYTAALAKVESESPGRCPYEFTTSGWAGPRVDLFLDTGGAAGGNFQGADLADMPCPPPVTEDGLFPISGGSGAADYSEFLAGLASPTVVPCPIAKGARLYPKTGQMVGPTKQGLTARGVSVDTCANEAAFNLAVTDIDGNNVYEIQDHTNPCLVVLILAVHINENYPGVETDTPGGPYISQMQHPDATDSDNDGEWRFARPANGASTPLIARRFAFFYITSLGSAQKPYSGIFMRGIDSGNANLDGSQCTADDGVCVVKLIP